MSDRWTGRVRRMPTADLSDAQVAEIRALMAIAFGDDEDDRFSDEDWDHSIGGIHFVLEEGGRIVTHASVVERAIEVAGVAHRTGYVEAVATVPEQQGSGAGSAVMLDVDAFIADGYELGVLGTGRHGFYGRLGWTTWHGPSGVRTPAGVIATPDDDGYLMILRTPTSPELDLDAAITCEWRPGDVW